MAFITCNCHSGILGKAISMNLIIPQQESGKERRVMYLLHGLSDDHTMWCRRTSIERYADKFNMTVVMPDGGRSFYTDALNGDNYWTFISEELPEIIKELFKLDPARENSFAAGLSMGGYGALKLGLRKPERFAAVGGLSSVTDIEYRYQAEDSASWRPEFDRIFGGIPQLIPHGNDLFDLAEKAVASGRKLPRMISICGADDFMIRDNRKFNDFMQKIAYPDFHCFERPGIHNWEFWDAHIAAVMDFFVNNQLPDR